MPNRLLVRRWRLGPGPQLPRVGSPSGKPGADRCAHLPGAQADRLARIGQRRPHGGLFEQAGSDEGAQFEGGTVQGGVAGPFRRSLYGLGLAFQSGLGVAGLASALDFG